MKFTMISIVRSGQYNIRTLTRLMFLAVFGWVFVSASAWAAGPTAEQLQLWQNLSPEQRAALIQQSSGDTAQAKPKQISNPKVVEPRSPEAGRLEREIKTPSADENKSDAEIITAPKAEVPVVEVAPQKSADRVEVRRAFDNYLREAKPMVVNAESLKQFGYELFAGEPSSFAPVTDVPVPPEYVMGPGDEIKVQLFGKDNKELVLTVDREGIVAFPQIGPIALAGLNFAQAKATLAEQIKQKMIGVSASITMGQLRSIRIFALGDVYRPGSYTVSGLATLSHALFASGGIKKIGSLRNIELKRGGRRVGIIDLYDFLLRGDTSKDMRLLPGDVVFVPSIGKTVAIAGEVIRPGIYEIKNERTVTDVLKLAGGLMPGAYASSALIERFNPKGDKQVVNFALTDTGLFTTVQNGDVIKVFPATDFEANQVLLIGNVKRPGKFAWHEGMRVLDLVQSRDDLLPESLMDYGIIEREAEDTREPMMMRFRLGELMEKGSAAGALNIELRPRDRLYVFQRANFREQPQLGITGSVQSPGQYEYKRNMRLADLVLAAGGLLRDTDIGAAEIYRTNPVTKEITLLKANMAGAMAGGTEDDILLQDLDRVVVHSIYETKQHDVVSAMGEVNNPATLPLSQGMRVADLVFAAGSVTEKAFLRKAEITRYKVISGERREADHLEIDLDAALRGNENANIQLQPYDVLMVRRISNWRAAEQVQVKGEVQYPGSYPVEEGERLSELLQRAGGFSKDAYLRAAVFTRESVRADEQKTIDDLVQRTETEVANMETIAASLKDEMLRTRQQRALEVAKRVAEQLKTVRATGRIVIKLDDFERLKGSEYDLALRDGDSLYVPKRPAEVLVLGEVYNQSAFIYRKNALRDEYLSMAGGVNRIGDADHVYVMRANGMVEAGSTGWFGPASANMEPGDAIVVPQNIEQFNLVDTSLDWTRVTMQLGVSLAAMKTIGVFQ